MSKVIAATLLALFCLSPFYGAGAIDTAPAFEDPALQARYEHVVRELRCLQCRSESLMDSNMQLAADLRRQVRELIAAGKTDEEIFKYMTDRYGDYVLYNPPLRPRTWLLWAAPVLLVLGGGIAAAIVISRKSKLPDTDPSDPGLGAS
jgi:cytochrome c-type biogenesis protein CcmH